MARNAHATGAPSRQAARRSEPCVINLVLGRWLLGCSSPFPRPRTACWRRTPRPSPVPRRGHPWTSPPQAVWEDMSTSALGFTLRFTISRLHWLRGSTISPLHAVSRKGSCSCSDLSSFHVSTGIEFTPPRCQGWLPEGTTSSSAIFHKCWG